MMVAGALAAVALAALFGATPPRAGAATHSAAAGSVAARGKVILDRYFAALAKLAKPDYVSYEYSVEQGGGTNISQVHRIYRAGGDVRDEAVQQDGRRLRRPRIHIRHDDVDRYALEAIAPTAARYTFTFTGVAKSGEHLAYTFRTEPKTAASFVVEEITLDGASYLPTVVRFRTTGAGVRGKGTFIYAKTDRYWMIREARVDAAYKEEPIGERIAWGAYRFPSSLPSATFADKVSDPDPLSGLAPRLGFGPAQRLAPSPSPRLGPKVVLRPKPSPRVRRGSKPAPHVSPTPLFDFSPSPSLRFSPSPVLRLSPRPVLRFSPSPLVHYSPSPVLTVTPIPMLRVSPSPVLNFTPSPTLEFSPSPPPRPVLKPVHVAPSPVPSHTPIPGPPEPDF